jgi:hypothetical protein
MADELTIHATMSFAKSSAALEHTKTAQVTVSGTECAQWVQTIGTSEEAIQLPPDIATLGYFMAENLDVTNFVSLRAGTGLGNFAKIPAGKFAGPFMLGSGATAPYAIADTGACRVKFSLVEA